ncbi:MAG TPA: hypothetical protein VM940_01585 [Chthoniobacterales bacterium]|jgi:hypothetical protein|nr:hypothetical protein [Chthoniobacterales bacterium]
MNRDEDEKLWDLLGRSREPQVSPFFARNVIRKIREAQGETPARSWFNLRWLMPATGLAVTVLAALLLRVQVPSQVTTDRADQIVMSEADDLDLLADVDDLMADDDSLVDDAVLL